MSRFRDVMDQPVSLSSYAAGLVLVLVGFIATVGIVDHVVNASKQAQHAKTCDAVRYTAPSLANLRAYQAKANCPQTGFPVIPKLPDPPAKGSMGATGKTGATGPTGPALRTVTAPPVTVTAVAPSVFVTQTVRSTVRATTRVTVRSTATVTCLPLGLDC